MTLAHARAVNVHPLVAFCVPLALLVGLASMPSTPAAAERSAVKARLLDAKTRAAAALAVRQALEDVAKTAVDPARLEALMTTDPSRHVESRDSRDRLLANERQLRRDRFAEQLDKFAQGITNLPAGWAARTVKAERKRVSARSETALRRDFHAAFEQARADTVAGQREALTTGLAPAPKDIESLVAADLQAFLDSDFSAIGAMVANRGQRLVTRLTRAASANQVLFAENQTHLQRLGTDAVRQRLQALWRQLGTVRQHAGGNALELTEITRNLRRDAESLAAPTVDGEAWSGVFALTDAAVARRAEALESAHLEAAVRRWFDAGYCSRLMTTNVAPAVVGELPPTLEVHRNELILDLRPGAWRAAVGLHAERIRSRELADQFRARMADLDSLSGAIASTFDWQFEACLTAVLSDARDRRGAAELEAAFPSVFDLSFTLDETSLEALLDNGPGADVSFPGSGELELHETRALFDERRERLLSEGRAVIRAQLELVDQRARAARFQQEVKALAAAERTPEARAALVDRYRDEVSTAWSETRTGLLLNPASDKYAALLSRVDDAIDKVITVEWEAPGQPSSAEVPEEPSAVAEDGGGDEDNPLAALLPPPTDVGMCPDPVCAQAADVCARFANACAEDGTGCAAAAPWRMACLRLSGQCAASGQ